MGIEYEGVDYISGNVETYIHRNPDGETPGTSTGKGGVAGNGLGPGLGLGLGLGLEPSPKTRHREAIATTLQSEVPRIESLKNSGYIMNVGNTHRGGSWIGGNVTYHVGMPSVPGGRRQEQ